MFVAYSCLRVFCTEYPLGCNHGGKGKRGIIGLITNSSVILPKSIPRVTILIVLLPGVYYTTAVGVSSQQCSRCGRMLRNWLSSSSNSTDLVIMSKKMPFLGPELMILAQVALQFCQTNTEHWWSRCKMTHHELYNIFRVKGALDNILKFYFWPNFIYHVKCNC